MDENEKGSVVNALFQELRLRSDGYTIESASGALKLAMQLGEALGEALEEMHVRELHHFESEQAMSEALAELTAPPDFTEVLDTPAGRALWKASQADKAKVILEKALQ